MEIILIRHTRVAVERGTCYGWSDVPVADTFTQEAETVRQRIEGCHFDQVYTSPLTRARLLASYCGYPDAIADPRLREMHMGDWEMKKYDEIDDPALQRWYADYLHLPATGGESFPVLCGRVHQFLDEVSRSGSQRVAIFAHAGVLVSAGIWAGLWEADDAFSHQVDYGGILRIDTDTRTIK